MGKVMREHGIKWEDITRLDLNYADNLSVLHENISELDVFWGVLTLRGYKNSFENKCWED